MDLERILVLTNPLLYIIYGIMYPCLWIAQIIGATRGFIKDYRFLKYQMDDLTEEHLKLVISMCNSKKWHKKWTDRKIKEKAKKMLQSN